MTNDELIRQVATEIKQNVYRATMEEALDAAKAVIELIGRIQDKYDQANAITLDVISMLADPYRDSRLPYIAGYLAEIDTLRLSATTGEDYQLLSTAPQIVDEVVDPEKTNTDRDRKKAALERSLESAQRLAEKLGLRPAPQIVEEIIDPEVKT